MVREQIELARRVFDAFSRRDVEGLKNGQIPGSFATSARRDEQSVRMEKTRVRIIVKDGRV
jgi:hypothetical protein